MREQFLTWDKDDMHQLVLHVVLVESDAAFRFREGKKKKKLM